MAFDHSRQRWFGTCSSKRTHVSDAVGYAKNPRHRFQFLTRRSRNQTGLVMMPRVSVDLLTERHAGQIAGVLGCWDRMLIFGTLPQICFAGEMTSFLYERQQSWGDDGE
jgi:hypothetical protein